tara:strand:+ start:171 stop:899 length:729 start_codon:yes stop_codon:yes gene_type:complete
MYESIISKQNLISLNETTHTYTLQNSDIEFSSVTEFIGRFFKTFDEQKVAEKLSKMSKYKGQTVNQILENWNNRKERGTIVHKEIETVILEANQNAKFDTKELVQLDIKTQMAIEFLKKCDIYKNNLIFPEVKVFSKQLKLAGTIDLMIYNKPKDEISLIDWKTNLEIKKTGYNMGVEPATRHTEDCSFNKYQLQLSMYRYILETFYDVKVNGLYILHLKESEFKYLKCQFQQNTILEMLKS